MKNYKMKNDIDLRKYPDPPTPPPSRILYESFGCDRMFDSQAEFDEYQRERLWRKMFLQTKYDKRKKKS